MVAALRILVDVAVFRLKKLEMANMFAAGAIMLALGLAWGEMAVRFGFGILLNLLAYLTNDYYDVDQDLSSPNKDHRKARFLKDHMPAALGAQIFLALFLAALALAWSPGLLVPLVLGAGICWVYSWKLKRLPYLDVLAMIAWGVTMPMVGFPPDSLLGWILVGQLALFSACFESIQVIRDYDEDIASGVRTTAVRLGIPATNVLLRVFMVLSALYAMLLVQRWAGAVLLLALFVPLDRTLVSAYWNRQRLLMGVAWLGLIGWVFWSGSTDGWLAQVGRDAVIEPLAFAR
ncbi:MAG TPA: UbiA family prenyltransferase [Polyangia bacterium]|nr:UbiA family prenyltransferase [Polyangia bacterium]